MSLRVVLAADSAGIAYKDMLKHDLDLDERVSSAIDMGLHEGEEVDYPHIAFTAAQMVAQGDADRAVLVCGTGLGMAIAANKVAGVRAVTAHDSYSVERSVLSNNAQILCIGARVVGPELARRLIYEWLGYCFDARSPSAEKVELISQYEVSGPLGLDATSTPEGEMKANAGTC